MSEPLSKSAHTTFFVGANHSGSVVTWRLHAGVLIYIINVLITWFLKNQNTVESSNFGSKLVAIRIARDVIVALRYKLRIFGVPLDGPSGVMCDESCVPGTRHLTHAVLPRAVSRHSTTGSPIVKT